MPSMEMHRFTTIISFLMMPSVEMNRFTTIFSFLMMPSVEMNRFTTIISITQIMTQKLYPKTFNIIIYIYAKPLLSYQDIK